MNEDIPEAARQSLMLLHVQVLIAEKDDAVIQERAPNRRDGVDVQVGGKIDP
jgi:hypothetical protein